jgi:hypothetical protein
VVVDFVPAVRGLLCAGLLGGGLYAQGHRLAESKSALVGWASVGNALEVVVDLAPHWSIDAGVVLVMPLQKTTIGVRTPAGDVVDARDAAPLGGAALIGPLYRF